MVICIGESAWPSSALVAKYHGTDNVFESCTEVQPTSSVPDKKFYLIPKLVRW